MVLVALKWSPKFSRHFWLFLGIFISVAVIWMGSYHIDVFPVTFVQGFGVTEFKANYEYVLCILYLAAAILLIKQADPAGLFQNYMLALSCFVMGIGELAFTAYVAPSDFQNIFGHTFKLFSYALLYQATFVSSLRIPFETIVLSENKLRESEEHLKAAEQIAHLGSWGLDIKSGNFILSEEVFNLIEIETIGLKIKHQQILETIHPEDRGKVKQAFIVALAKKIPFEMTHRLRMRDGRIKWVYERCTTEYDASGKPIYARGFVQDITERKLTEEKIHNLAFYDALTHLPNRRLLLDRLHSAISVSVRNQHYASLLFIDMDKFKNINDTLGHNFGDLLLVEVARRIVMCVRETDTVSRLGGDEFVVLLEDVDEKIEFATQKTALISEKIRAVLSLPYRLKERLYHCSPSIGVTVFSGNSETSTDLLMQADFAMYQAKDAGRNVVRFFDPKMQMALETRSSIETDLHEAVSGNQLCLYYQIQFDEDLRPMGAEALVRWNHPERGLIMPMQFIPIAESSSLIIDVGDWVLETACCQLDKWSKDESTRDLTLSVNVSAIQFKQSDFVEKIKAKTLRYNIKRSHLKLELTESVVLSDVADMVGKMHALKEIGIGLAMDDFGTGYSSLSYLKQLPLDQIKIDQSFVRNLCVDQNDAVMVKTIIDLAKNFHLNVIAEGVETEPQYNLLNELGCMAYQGYYFNKPLPIEQLDVLTERV